MFIISETIRATLDALALNVQMGLRLVAKQFYSGECQLIRRSMNESLKRASSNDLDSLLKLFRA